ncbi:MAG TPA: NAD(P)-dependent oxidoreductase [Gaiellaceae bacterium]|nr:NAD(P)-dependent oxidoreductase [Gaiellaceae bacterium]
MRILITGAAGFVGTHALERLGAEHELYPVVRRAPDETREWIVQDLTQPLDRSRLPARIDAVIHLAQSPRYREFPEGAEDVYAVNVHSTFELLEYARTAGAQSFVLASSGGVYGYSYETLVETSPMRPLNFYLTSKHIAESLAATYQAFFRTVVLRFFFVYGPGQERMLVPTLIEKVRKGDQISIAGRPGQRINPIHVEDAVEVFPPALELSRSDVFNVAGEEVVSIRDLVDVIEQATGERAHVRHIDPQPAGDLVADNSRMKEVLGVRPSVSLLGGIRSML